MTIEMGLGPVNQDVVTPNPDRCMVMRNREAENLSMQFVWSRNCPAKLDKSIRCNARTVRVLPVGGLQIPVWRISPRRSEMESTFQESLLEDTQLPGSTSRAALT